MRNDVKLNGSLVTASGAECDQFLESVFFTGSGHMGTRGCTALRDEPRPLDAGLFIAGIFDRITAGSPITDFAALPTPVWALVELPGGRVRICSNVERCLDLETGELKLSYSVQAGNTTAYMTERRVFPLDDPACVYQRFTLRGDEAALTLGIDEDICNCPIPDDQVKENSETVQLFTKLHSDAGGGINAEYATRHTGLGIQFDMRFLSANACERVSDHALRFTGAELSVDSACLVLTSRDADARIAALLPEDIGYDAALERARTALAKRWADCAVSIDGDSESESALRYVTYQLLANTPARDSTVSIGARGLTHTRYKGCCFWDTEMFILPFCLLTDPAAARRLLEFRARTLPAAKEHAEKMNATGARYPWMVSLDGSEQCESWDIGCSEVHVTADIAYAVGQYLDWTLDEDFFKGGGAHILVETARFWPSRYSPAPGGGVNLLFCKGPDEYCGITSNNLYTNCMVRCNLAIAGAAAAALEQLDAEQYASLGITHAEVDSWHALHEQIKLPRDAETGRYLQDDTFQLLEQVDITTIKPDDSAAYSRVCFDALQRLQVIKQADVLLLMTRLPELFTAEEKLDAWADFEPKCIHDSTLSFATHALFAAQNGLEGDAVRYFEKALWLDLHDVMGNTGKEGLHLACLGETWQTVVFGFAGLSLENGEPVFRPHLPDKWRALSFCFYLRGKKYRAEITHGGAKITEA